uniref:Uncharacterized protein n=1 Tax=viral metagenome TaxID=1070528 RepID=A0A6C0JGR6_9ZZZZ
MNIFIYLFIPPIFNLIRQYRLYPIWLKKRSDNMRIPCKVDEDCPFPSACCNDPFFPSEYCCNGWKARQLEYAYAKNVIQRSPQ